MREASLTLFELNTLVRQAIEGTLNREYWVEAELSECRESHGHCYMELVQKADANATPIALSGLPFSPISCARQDSRCMPGSR